MKEINLRIGRILLFLVLHFLIFPFRTPTLQLFAEESQPNEPAAKEKNWRSTRTYYDAEKKKVMIETLMRLDTRAPEGPTRYYYASGKLAMECRYEVGVLKDSCFAFTESRKLANGRVKAFYPFGWWKLAFEFKAVHGRPEGVFKRRFASGALGEETVFKDGKMEGVRKEYYESGKLKAQVTMRAGVNDGPWKTYFESGQLKEESLVKNWRPSGFIKQYSEAGNLKAEYIEQPGQELWECKAYYPTGQLMSKGYCKDGQPEGLITLYNRLGKVISEVSYKDGKQVEEVESSLPIPEKPV